MLLTNDFANLWLETLILQLYSRDVSHCDTIGMLTRSQFDFACKALIAKYAGCSSSSPAERAYARWTWHEHPVRPLHPSILLCS